MGKILWRRKWQPTPVFFPGEAHGERSLVGYSPWGRRVRHDWSHLACMPAWYIRIRWKNSYLLMKYMHIFILIYFPLAVLGLRALCGLSLAEASRGCSSLRCVGCPLWWLLLQGSSRSSSGGRGAHRLWHAGSRVCRRQELWNVGQVASACGL